MNFLIELKMTLYFPFSWFYVIFSQEPTCITNMCCWKKLYSIVVVWNISVHVWESKKPTVGLVEKNVALPIHIVQQLVFPEHQIASKKDDKAVGWPDAWSFQDT